MRRRLPFCIPIRHHGDDVALKSLGAAKLCVVSLHGELCTLDCLSSRLLSFVLYDDLLIPNKTFPQIMAAWAWSWKCAIEGCYPVCDHAGKPFEDVRPGMPGAMRFANRGKTIGGPYTFAYAGGLGDWVFHVKLYAPFFNSHKHNFICTRDLASKVLPDFLYHNFTPEAGSASNILMAAFCMNWFGPSIW